MEPAAPRRSRRTTSRRNIFIDASDGEDGAALEKVHEDGEFVASTSTTVAEHRKARKISKLPAKSSSAPKAQTLGDMEQQENFAVRDHASQVLLSPSKAASPEKRRSIASGKRIGELAIPQMSLPSVLPTRTKDIPQLEPLTDITNATLNNQFPTVNHPKENTTTLSTEAHLDHATRIGLGAKSLEVQATESGTGPKSRTVIKYLVLHNFKSYAGRQVVGPFHASFSSVVGPNGSGKSNVIDSLLFVFGFRASKMRQGKISALIHNSAAHPDLDFCEVEVHFEEVIDLPNGKHKILPGSPLIISRKASKNNSSKYYLNAHESSFTAITSLLKRKGVDLDHKRFLILQGEVESIAQMKPKAGNQHEDGLLEYLEDIIGTSRYKTPIEESAAEVESLNEVCLEKNSRVQHVEKERENLEDSKNKAIGYIKDDNELVRKQSALYQIYVGECEDNIKVAEEAVAIIQNQLNEELTKHQGNAEIIKILETAFKNGQKECNALEKRAEQFTKELAMLDKEKVKLDEKKKFLSTKHKKLEKTAQASRFSASEDASLVEKLSDDMARYKQEIESLESVVGAELKELESIRDALKGKTQVFSDQITTRQKELEPWSDKISQKESAIAIAKSELEIMKEKASATNNAVKELQEKIKSIRNIKLSQVTDLNSLVDEKTKTEKKIESNRRQASELEKEEPGLRSKISAARQRADEVRASFAKSQSENQVLSALMRLKSSGRIDGFHNRLGNLGTIEDKYDVAISTACPSLDNLVVDSVEAGQQCIDYLRKNNLGRANFILLNKIARRDTSPIETPEGVPRLFDLVNPSEDIFRAAFYSVLQNTLVADNLDQANRIAYGARRWRVVTLHGQLIDVSGTMSGGGSRVAEGAMSSKPTVNVTKEQVSKLEADRDFSEREYQSLQLERQSYENQSQELQTRLPELDIRIQKKALEIESSNRNLSDAEERLSEFGSQKQPSEHEDAEMLALQNRISCLESDLVEYRSETSEVENRIKELQDKIMEIGGVRLRSQKAKVDGICEQIDTLSEETTNAEVSKAKAVKDKAKHERSLEQALKDLEAGMKEIEELDLDCDQQKEQQEEVRKKVLEMNSALLDKKDELDVMKRELDDKTTQINQSRASEIETKIKLEETQRQYSENQKRLSYWIDKLGALKLHSLKDLQECEETDLSQYTQDELLDMDRDTLKAEIAALEEKTQNFNVDLGVLGEYRRRVEEHSSRSDDLQVAVSSRDTAKRRHEELRRLRLEGFMEGFSLISLRLKEMYQMITMGGNAELELVDSLDPFSEGILFSVMPPKKSWKNISNLSGGEKTLSSLALVFALHHYKPTPLYVMDEIDAALDFRNVSIVASYIRERTKNAQFVVISLRNNMFELASRLVGVYKVSNQSKSVAIENKNYIKT